MNRRNFVKSAAVAPAMLSPAFAAPAPRAPHSMPKS